MPSIHHSAMLKKEVDARYLLMQRDNGTFSIDVQMQDNKPALYSARANDLPQNLFAVIVNRSWQSVSAGKFQFKKGQTESALRSKGMLNFKSHFQK